MRDSTRFGLTLLAAFLACGALSLPHARGEANETHNAEPIARLGVPQLASWSPLQLSFSPDGKLMTANASQPPSIWRVADGAFVEQIESRKDWQPRGATFISDRELLCFGAAPPRLAVADVRSGRLMHEPGFGQKSLFNVIASPRSNALLIVGERTELWSLSPMKRVRVLVDVDARQSSFAERVASVGFSSDGSVVLLTRQPGDMLELWDAKSGERLPFFLDLNARRRVPAVGSAGGRFVATFDETLRLYDTAKQHEVAGLEMPPDLDRADVAMAFAPTGDTLAVTVGANLFLIDPAKGITARSAMPEKSRGMFSGAGLFWSPDEKVLLVHASSGRLMRFSRPALQAIDGAASTGPVVGVAIRSDGRAAYSLDVFGKARKWDVQASKCTNTVDAWTESRASVPLFALSHDQKRLVAVSPTGSVRLFDADDLSPIRKHELQLRFDHAVWSTDSTRLVVASQPDATVDVVDMTTGEKILHIKPPMREVSNLVISADGQTICAAEASQVCLFSTKTGEQLARIRIPSSSIRFIGDDHLLTVANNHRAVIRVSEARIIWRSDQHKPAAPNLPPTELEAREIPRPIPDSAQIIFTLGLTQTRLRANDGHVGGIASYAASTHGRYVATGGMDGQVLIYDLAKMLAKTDDDSRPLFDDLADPDGRVAVGAIAALALDPELRARVTERFRTRQKDRARFGRLIAQLNDADVSERDAAHRELEREADAPAVATAIAEALATGPGGELRDRLESLSRLAGALATRPATTSSTPAPPDIGLLLDRLAIANQWAGINEPPATQPIEK